VKRSLPTSWAWSVCLTLTLLFHRNAIAQGGVVFVKPQQSIFYNVLAPFQNEIDVDGDDVADFSLFGPAAETSVGNAVIAPLGSNSVIAIPEPPPDLGFLVAALERGQTIGPSLDSILDAQWYSNETDQFGHATISAVAAFDSSFSEISHFAGLPSGYIGFDLVNSGTNYFGWMYVTSIVSDAAIYGEVTSWAYESTPNTPIKAGQIIDSISLVANLTGSNEVPSNKSTHSGKGTFALDSFVDGYALTYHLELDSSFQPTSAGIFGPANPDNRSSQLIADLGDGSISNLPPTPFPPIAPLSTEIQRPPAPFSPQPSILVYDGQITLTGGQVLQLLRGSLYLNLKTSKFRQGELRGQIWSVTPKEFSTLLRGRNEVPPNNSQRRGEAAFSLSGSTLAWQVALDNFPFKQVGVFTGPNTKNPIIQLNTKFGVQIPVGGFPNAIGLPHQFLYTGGLTLTDRQVLQLRTGELFLDVLTSRFPHGEIAGRILVTR